MWHYYCGAVLTIYEIDQQGSLTQTLLGNPLENPDTYPQHIIPAKTWFAAKLHQPKANAFTLAGCTVSPGFLYEDFEIGKREFLLEQFPQHKKVIEELTRL